MEKLIESKLKEIYLLKRKIMEKRIRYISFIKQKKPGISNVLKTLMNYKMTLIERKINSPLNGLLEKRTVDNFIKDQKLKKDAISLLTDRKHFGSSYYEMVKKGNYVKNLPKLKKEFIISKLQLYLYPYGYDIILIIWGLNSKKKTKNIIKLAKFFNLVTIIEAKDIKEILSIRKESKGNIIGVNSRNLKNFKIRKNKILELKRKKNIVFESGILNKNELIKVRNIGFKGVLIGSGLSKDSFYLKN
ncbi:hypothetical protein JSR06_00195 [Candidatus Vidania fulgoroideae]|uniref:indole-3-glycerol-phosphate synthase n=1 Tax=Candidatus Vidania fulgoroideorum TaxID=881286 RepID=A0A975ADV5_9PROT|nr:hypothetical protein JSR06_00195 [Candidatus Vidania fulgoroideae]